MEWVEKTGKTVEAAKDAALDALGVHEDDAEFDVVKEARVGLFGRVKDEARVRARVKPATPRAKDDRRRKRGRGGNNRNRAKAGQNRGAGQGDENKGKSQKSSSSEPKSRASQGSKPGTDGSARAERNGQQAKKKKQAARETREKAETMNGETMNDEPTMPLPQQADIAEDFVRGLASAMGSSVAFTREQVADDEIRVTVQGDNLGRLIGPRGGTAMAVDDLVRSVLQRHAGSSRDGRVRVDIGGLRARRADALAAFCRQQAEAVRSDGQARALDPMGGSDRKIVHDTIADEDGVATTSEGEEPYRRVVIVPAGDAG